jgi:hypothetical protein
MNGRNDETGPQHAGLCSHHSPLYLEIAVSLKFKNSCQRFHFDFSRAHYNTMNTLFTLLPLSSGVVNVNSTEELDSHWEFWNDIVFPTANDCIPKVKCRCPNFPHWIRKDLANAINFKKYPMEKSQKLKRHRSERKIS